MSDDATPSGGDGQEWDECPNCESKNIVPVWNTVSKFRKGMEPDYVGCRDCNEMERTESWGQE